VVENSQYLRATAPEKQNKRNSYIFYCLPVLYSLVAVVLVVVVVAVVVVGRGGGGGFLVFFLYEKVASADGIIEKLVLSLECFSFQ